jgi:hypothetical protein
MLQRTFSKDRRLIVAMTNTVLNFFSFFSSSFSFLIFCFSLFSIYLFRHTIQVAANYPFTSLFVLLLFHSYSFLSVSYRHSCTDISADHCCQKALISAKSRIVLDRQVFILSLNFMAKNAETRQQWYTAPQHLPKLLVKDSTDSNIAAPQQLLKLAIFV